MTIKLQSLTSENADSAFELATRVFVEGSTLHSALGIDLVTYRNYLRPSFDAMLEEQLSVLAIDDETGEVAGCLIVSDFCTHQLSPLPSDKRFAALVALTNALCRKYRQVRSLAPGEVILVDMGAVSSSFAGKGVYQIMRDAAQIAARRAGFRKVVGELSSASTQHVVIKKLGHRKVAEIAFAEFEFDGNRPFSLIKSPETIILAEGSL